MKAIKIRALVGVMIFLGYVLMYLVRYNICVHIVDMSKVGLIKMVESQSNTTFTRGGSSRSIVDSISWDDMKMARFFSAYHIGYCICFPIFHSIGDKLGPTWVVGITGLVSSVLNCLTPAAVYYNYWMVFGLRILLGFSAGAMQPSMVQLLRHWVPPIERIYFMWAYCGITTGTCFTFMACAAIHYYSRWPVGFYLAGGLQAVWVLAWLFLVTDNPRNHNFIANEELTYLTNTIGTVFAIKVTNSQTPWNLILTSKCFWALCCLNFGYAWMIIALCIHGTMYYSRVVDYSLYSAAALTGLPFFLRLVLGTLVIHIFFWYKTNTQVKRIKHIRKIMIVVSHIVPGLLVMSTWLIPVVPGPILLTIAVALTAAGMDLTFDLCYVLSPTYVNSIHTVIKMIGTTPGIIVSFLVGEVIHKHKNSAWAWKHMWCFHATVLFVSGLVFLIWGETHVQHWNSVRQSPRRAPRVKPVTSIMSNIIEVDEDETSTRLSNQQTKINFLSVPIRTSKEIKQ